MSSVMEIGIRAWKYGSGYHKRQGWMSAVPAIVVTRRARVCWSRSANLAVDLAKSAGLTNAKIQVSLPVVNSGKY